MPIRTLARARSLAFAAVVAISAPAAAQNTGDDALSKVASLNQEATSAFKRYSYRGGARKLREAIKIAEDAGRGKDAALAPTYALLGVAAVAGRSDTYRGLHFFVHARRLASNIVVPPDLMTPELVEAWRAAGRALKALGPPPRLALGRRRVAASMRIKKVKGARGLAHEPLDEVKRGYPVAIKATVGDDLRVARVVLFYRGAGKVKYTKEVMKRGANVFRGQIPASLTKGRYVHYYIQALDPRGRLAAHNGSARGPNVVTVKK